MWAKYKKKKTLDNYNINKWLKLKYLKWETKSREHKWNLKHQNFYAYEDIYILNMRYELGCLIFLPHLQIDTLLSYFSCWQKLLIFHFFSAQGPWLNCCIFFSKLSADCEYLSWITFFFFPPHVPVYQVCITQHFVRDKRKQKQDLRHKYILGCYLLLSPNCQMARSKNITISTVIVAACILFTQKPKLLLFIMRNSVWGCAFCTNEFLS